MSHQLRTLSKQRLAGHLGRVDSPDIRQAVRQAMRTQLDLD